MLQFLAMHRATAPAPLSWARTWGVRLCVAVLALSALVLARAGAGLRVAEASVGQSSGPRIRAGSSSNAVDAVVRRAEAQVKRAPSWLDHRLPPFSAGHGSARSALSIRRRRLGLALAAPAGAPPRPQIGQFRKRIPRLNSEDPPWA